MDKRLENLGKLDSVMALKKELRAICSAYGVVARLEVLVANQVGKRRALCFVGMQTTEQEQAVMRELQLGRFGGDVIAIVELEKDIQPEREFFKAPRTENTGHGAFQPTLPIAALIKPSAFSKPGRSDFFDSRPMSDSQ